MRPLSFALASLSLLVMTGCAGISKFDIVAPATASSLKGLQGRVHGGRQPITGAQVYMFAASHRATIGTPTPSVGLMTSASSGDFPTAYDPTLNAYYVTTDANGNFGITGEYACSAGDQVYLYVLGGDAGAGNNPYSTLMAVLGNCPGSGDQFASIYPFVAINETTTVAAAYALAGFAVDPLTVSSNMTDQGLLGLSNAFATAANLADITSAGAALATTPTAGGIVPQAEINTLANAVAACINSGGNSLAYAPDAIPATYSASCSTLLSAAVTTNGVAATDTADALINLAHNPSAGGQSNVTAIYDLAPGIGAAFQPSLTAITPPTDFSIAISYPAGNGHKALLAVDSVGNIWATNYSLNSVAEISPLGVLISPADGFTDGGMNNPQSLAFDANGRLWVANSNGTGVSELNADGSAVSGSPFTPNSGGTSYPLSGVGGIAVDAANQIWVPGDGSNSVTVLTNANGTCLVADCVAFNLNDADRVAIDTAGEAWTTSGGTGCLTDVNYNPSNMPTLSAASNFCQADFTITNLFSIAIAIDSNGTKWVAQATSSQITSVTAGGTVTSYPAGGQPDGGLNLPVGIAIDGGGNAWMVNTNGGPASISEFTDAGVPLSPSSAGPTVVGGFQSTNGNLQSLGSIAVDPSGNVWVSDYAKTYLTELVGAAVPVVTPIVAGVAAGMLGTQP